MKLHGPKETLTWLIHESKKIIPKSIYDTLAPYYHYTLTIIGAIFYRFPSKEMFVVGITGTKGKTTTIEIINKILEEAGKKPAIASTLRFKIGDHSTRNLFKMTMPGRFFLQRFLREAVDSGATHMIIEMTSEGVKQYRHKFIDLDALIFTNLSPEHIESHGSYEDYINAKLEIARSLESSVKSNKWIIVNRDDKEAEKFLSINVSNKIKYGIADAELKSRDETGCTFTFNGMEMKTTLKGEFNIYNILAAATFAFSQSISLEVIKNAVEKLSVVSGRMEYIKESHPDGSGFNDFDIVVDYAHTPDSLLKAYSALEHKTKICVLGGTGGGRDQWKRPEMGKIAAENCKKIILTTEDPYDEPPMAIINDIKEGADKKIAEIKNSGNAIPELEVIENRKDAIRKAINSAESGGVIIITGKGTDPYIMGPNGTKEPWDDATVARELLKEYLF